MKTTTVLIILLTTILIHCKKEDPAPEVPVVAEPTEQENKTNDTKSYFLGKKVVIVGNVIEDSVGKLYRTKRQYIDTMMIQADGKFSIIMRDYVLNDSMVLLKPDFSNAQVSYYNWKASGILTIAGDSVFITNHPYHGSYAFKKSDITGMSQAFSGIGLSLVRKEGKGNAIRPIVIL